MPIPSLPLVSQEAPITEFHLYNKKIYLSPILDLYNGEIISYNISDHPRFSQVTTMLNQAFEKIPDNTGLILHSDQVAIPHESLQRGTEGQGDPSEHVS